MELFLSGLLFIGSSLVAVFASMFTYKQCSKSLETLSIKYDTLTFTSVYQAAMLVGLAAIVLVCSSNKKGKRIK